MTDTVLDRSIDTDPTDTGAAASRRRGIRAWKTRQLAQLGAALVVVPGALLYGLHWWTVGRFIEGTDDAYVGGDVTVIAPRVSGFIAQVAVTDNQAVHAGDLLVRLDDRDYRAALARADAAVAAQPAAHPNLAATRQLQHAVIAQAHAGVTAADAEVVRTHQEQERFGQLVAHAATSTEAFQKADAEYKESVAGRERAQGALLAATGQLDVLATQEQEIRAALAGAIAERDTARLNLGYTELRAPIDGTVGNRSARAGAYASVGSQLLALVPARGLWVDANFKESQLTHMRPGQSARIVADVLPGEVLTGHVDSLSPATGAQFSVLPAENATGNFTRIVQRVPVRIRLDGSASLLGRLRPGLSVTAEVDERGPTDTHP